MKKRIVLILTALIVTSMMAFAVSAEPEATLTPEAIESLKEAYKEANVVLDIYCIGIFNGTGYELTDAYKGLDLSGKDLTKTEDLNALTQEALKATFAEGSKAVPVNGDTPAKLDEKINDLPLGLYLNVAYGSDLKTPDKYLKTVKDADGEDTLVTIAKTETKEYRFSPSLLAMNYENADAEIQIKAQESGLYGRLRIKKSVESYNEAHPVTFVFKLDITEEDGTKSVDYAGLTLNGTGSGYVDVNHLPIGATVVVTEEYAGSDLTLVSGPTPASVKIEADETAVVSVETGDGSGQTADPADGNEPKAQVSFINKFHQEENHGYGFTNTFVNNGSTWDWYQDGQLMTGKEES